MQESAARFARGTQHGPDRDLSGVTTKSCDVFLPKSPHYAAGGAETVAKVMSA